MNDHEDRVNAFTESLMAMTGIADSPELIACVDSWYFSRSFETACSKYSISDLFMFKMTRKREKEETLNLCR